MKRLALYVFGIIGVSTMTMGCTGRHEPPLSIAVINRTGVELYTDGLYVTDMDRRGRAASILAPHQRSFERYAGIRHLPDTVHLYFGSKQFPAGVNPSHWVTLEKMSGSVPPDDDGTLVFTINPDYRVGVFYLSRAQQSAGVDVPDNVEPYPHQRSENRLPPEPATPPPPVSRPDNPYR